MPIRLPPINVARRQALVDASMNLGRLTHNEPTIAIDNSQVERALAMYLGIEEERHRLAMVEAAPKQGWRRPLRKAHRSMIAGDLADSLDDLWDLHADIVHSALESIVVDPESPHKLRRHALRQIHVTSPRPTTDFSKDSTYVAIRTAQLRGERQLVGKGRRPCVLVSRRAIMDQLAPALAQVVDSPGKASELATVTAELQAARAEANLEYSRPGIHATPEIKDLRHAVRQHQERLVEEYEPALNPLRAGRDVPADERKTWTEFVMLLDSSRSPDDDGRLVQLSPAFRREAEILLAGTGLAAVNEMLDYLPPAMTKGQALGR
jgi:hypothetical protein